MESPVKNRTPSGTSTPTPPGRAPCPHAGYQGKHWKTRGNSLSSPISATHAEMPAPPGARPTEEYVRFYIAHNFLFVC